MAENRAIRDHSLRKMGHLGDLLAQLDEDQVRRGSQFERICKWFLTNDPLYQHRVRRVWLWDEWPGRWGADAGIDLVVEEREGGLWAVQAKAYDPAYSVTKADVGNVTEHQGKDGRTYRSLRFTAYGKRRRVPLGAVSAPDAESALRHVIADVERGTWTPPQAMQPPVESDPVPTFHAFVEEWWERHKMQYAPKTQEDYSWRLQVHLIKFFGPMRLDAITFDTVERYIAAKLAEDDPLSARSINMTLTLLAAILERAVERDLIARNPARGRDRRVRQRAPNRPHLDAAGQIEAPLDAAGELDREAAPTGEHIRRRAMLATLTFAGLRIGEMCALRWRDVDLAGGWLRVGEAKTDAGRRDVKIRGALRDELVRIRDGQGPDEYVFPTLTGARQGANNFRARVLRVAVKRANERVAERDLPPLPDKITPHSLRRTFCSLLYALGEDPGVVMDEMGHTDPALALRVYRQAMRRDEGQKARLRALVEGSALTVEASEGAVAVT